LAYGSGSKSKVFEGAIQPQWKKAYQINLFETLKIVLKLILKPTKLHKEQNKSVRTPKTNGF
jgi:hydroxymethylglutaryl-CoA synthase